MLLHLVVHEQILLLLFFQFTVLAVQVIQGTIRVGGNGRGDRQHRGAHHRCQDPLAASLHGICLVLSVCTFAVGFLLSNFRLLSYQNRKFPFT